jgi:hypothetical protein
MGIGGTGRHWVPRALCGVGLPSRRGPVGRDRASSKAGLHCKARWPAYGRRRPDQHRLFTTLEPEPVCEHLFVTSQGSPYGRFRRALDNQNAMAALSAAAELPTVGLVDALELVLLLRDKARRRAARGGTPGRACDDAADRYRLLRCAQRRWLAPARARAHTATAERRVARLTKEGRCRTNQPSIASQSITRERS